MLRLGPTAWTMAQERIAAIGVTVDHTTDEAFLREAARLKAERAPIVLGDVFAVALTARLGGTLVTTDRGELTKVAAAGDCLIEFLR